MPARPLAQHPPEELLLVLLAPTRRVPTRARPLPWGSQRVLSPQPAQSWALEQARVPLDQVRVPLERQQHPARAEPLDFVQERERRTAPGLARKRTRCASRLFSARLRHRTVLLVQLEQRRSARRDDPVRFRRRQEALEELALVDGPEDRADAVLAKLLNVLGLWALRPGRPPGNAILGDHLVDVILEQALGDR